MKLEQLERLHSEILPRRPMITHTSDSHQTQSQNKTKSSYKFKKIAKNANFETLQETLHATHFLKLFDKMYKYEMDPTRTVGATEQTRDARQTRDGRRTDGWTDGRTEWNQYNPQQLRCAGGIMRKTSQSMPVTPNGLHSNQKYTHTGNPNKAALPSQTHECVVEKCMAEWMNEWRMSEGVIGCVIEWVGKGMIERAEE